LRKVAVFIAALGAVVLMLVWGAPVHAQPLRTWVSSFGSDANPCSLTQPCQTFDGAIPKTAVGGEVNCLDASGYGSVTIRVSITLDCHDVFASILLPGITVVADNTNAPVVRIRNLNINGITGSFAFTPVGDRICPSGITIVGANTANTVVIIEDVLIDGFCSRGITDGRTGGGELIVTNTTVRNNVGTGINVGGVKASLDRVRSLRNAIGVAVGTGGILNLADSVLAGNTSAGIETEGTAIAKLDHTQITGNQIGIQVVGGSVALNNSDVTFNPTAAIGSVSSYGNNRFFTNGPGGTIVPIGTTANPTGLQ